MFELFEQAYFVNFVVPMITTGLTIFLKINSRRDDTNTKLIRREDYAIGFEVICTSLVLLCTQYFNLSKKLNNASDNNLKTTIIKFQGDFIGWILAVFIIILALNFIIRRFGWDANNKSEPTWWWGVIFPDIIGIALLIKIVLWSTQ